MNYTKQTIIYMHVPDNDWLLLLLLFINEIALHGTAKRLNILFFSEVTTSEVTVDCPCDSKKIGFCT